MSPTDAVHTFGITADSPSNTYSAGKPLDAYARQFSGKRLDYILYGAPAHPLPSSRVPLLDPIRSDVVFTENVPGKPYSFSDHFGLEATFTIRLADGKPGDVNKTSGVVQTDPPPGLSDASVTTLIQALTASYRISRSNQRIYLVIFFVSLFVVIGLIIGSAWSPHSWINPIFLVVTTVLAWLATTMLYAGFLYCNYEANTLDNIIEELELYRGTIRRD
jgi:sphingomyelin phosphodiesterase 2